MHDVNAKCIYAEKNMNYPWARHRLKVKCVKGKSKREFNNVKSSVKTQRPNSNPPRVFDAHQIQMTIKYTQNLIPKQMMCTTNLPENQFISFQ